MKPLRRSVTPEQARELLASHTHFRLTPGGREVLAALREIAETERTQQLDAFSPDDPEAA